MLGTENTLHTCTHAHITHMHTSTHAHGVHNDTHMEATAVSSFRFELKTTHSSTMRDLKPWVIDTVADALSGWGGEGAEAIRVSPKRAAAVQRHTGVRIVVGGLTLARSIPKILVAAVSISLMVCAPQAIATQRGIKVAHESLQHGERQTETDRDRQRRRQRERDRETDRERERQRDRETHMHTHANTCA